MQGQYSGLRSYIQAENSSAIYVWCFAHVLNLVVVDTCDSCEEAKNFFGTLQVFVEFMSARKRTEIYVQCQKRLHPEAGKRVRRLKYLSTTRWTSHYRAINVLEDTFDSLIAALNEIKLDADRKSSTLAEIYLDKISKFVLILTLFVMKRIFEITTPLSEYLQAKQLDFLHALSLVDNAQQMLQSLTKRGENELFLEIVKEAKEFAINHDLEERNLKEVRVPKKKLMPGETSQDETPVLAIDRYRTRVFYEITSTAELSIKSRLNQSRNVLKDLSILSEERINSFVQGKSSIPPEAFDNISMWLKGVDASLLRKEYTMFGKNLQVLKLSECSSKPLSSDTIDHNNELRNSESDSSDEVSGATPSKSYTMLQILKLLSSFGLQSAFPNLYTLYKAACTIPSSSASAERAFSKLKQIKTRLRSTMGEE